jgi:hypothetical protein
VSLFHHPDVISNKNNFPVAPRNPLRVLFRERLAVGAFWIGVGTSISMGSRSSGAASNTRVVLEESSRSNSKMKRFSYRRGVYQACGRPRPRRGDHRRVAAQKSSLRDKIFVDRGGKVGIYGASCFH